MSPLRNEPLPPGMLVAMSNVLFTRYAPVTSSFGSCEPEPDPLPSSSSWLLSPQPVNARARARLREAIFFIAAAVYQIVGSHCQLFLGRRPLSNQIVQGISTAGRHRSVGHRWVESSSKRRAT